MVLRCSSPAPGHPGAGERQSLWRGRGVGLAFQGPRFRPEPASFSSRNMHTCFPCSMSQHPRQPGCGPQVCDPRSLPPWSVCSPQHPQAPSSPRDLKPGVLLRAGSSPTPNMRYVEALLLTLVSWGPPPSGPLTLPHSWAGLQPHSALLSLPATCALGDPSSTPTLQGRGGTSAL